MRTKWQIIQAATALLPDPSTWPNYEVIVHVPIEFDSPVGENNSTSSAVEITYTRVIFRKLRIYTSDWIWVFQAI